MDGIEKDKEDFFNGEPNEDKIESLPKRFERERIEWKEIIINLNKKLENIYECSEILVDIYSQRQKALDYTHFLMYHISKINAELRKKKKERFIYYSNSYDIRLDKDPKNMFIEVDLENLVLKQECIDNHLKYMRSTIDTLDKLMFGIKLRVDLQIYERKQH